MNGNMNLGKRLTALEKDGGAGIKKEISDLQVAVTTAQSDIDALETKVNSGHVYSTEEQIVGTWIDNNTIYQKTLTGTSTQGEYRIDVSNLNISHFIGYQLNELVNVIGNDNVYYPYYGGNDDFLRIYYNAVDKDIIFVSGARWSHGEYSLTFQYTKTTDNPTQ